MSSFHHAPLIVDLIRMVASPEAGPERLLVLQDEHGSSVTIRVTDKALRKLAEILDSPEATPPAT